MARPSELCFGDVVAFSSADAPKTPSAYLQADGFLDSRLLVRAVGDIERALPHGSLSVADFQVCLFELVASEGELEHSAGERSLTGCITAFHHRLSAFRNLVRNLLLVNRFSLPIRRHRTIPTFSYSFHGRDANPLRPACAHAARSQ